MVLKWENVTGTVLFEFFRASVITNLDCFFIKRWGKLDYKV